MKLLEWAFDFHEWVDEKSSFLGDALGLFAFFFIVGPAAICMIALAFVWVVFLLGGLFALLGIDFGIPGDPCGGAKEGAK